MTLHVKIIKNLPFNLMRRRLGEANALTDFDILTKLKNVSTRDWQKKRMATKAFVSNLYKISNYCLIAHFRLDFPKSCSRMLMGYLSVIKSKNNCMTHIISSWVNSVFFFNGRVANLLYIELYSFLYISKHFFFQIHKMFIYFYIL